IEEDAKRLPARASVGDFPGRSGSAADMQLFRGRPVHVGFGFSAHRFDLAAFAGSHRPRLRPGQRGGTAQDRVRERDQALPDGFELRRHQTKTAAGAIRAGRPVTRSITMSYDLIIRNGTIVDGSGLPRYQADLGIVGDRIASIGKVGSTAKQVIDAEGHVVSPGFIDGHTHMDAQIFWDALGTCSCWHGVTSVVMGNCGFSLAPCAEKDKLLVMKNLERAEDISPRAMEAGIKWSWDDFAQYLDAVDRLAKGINYTAYVGHSALRTYVMGERAFTEQANSEDLSAMKRELRNALQAGAAGFSTSRNRNHETPDSRPVASRLAAWDEVRQLVGVMGELRAGVFELAQESVER